MNLATANWPDFIWEAEALLPFLSKTRLEQGKLLARAKGLGFELPIRQYNKVSSFVIESVAFN